MERPVVSTSKVRIVCLPLHSAPDRIKTWTYFLPSEKINSANLSWKRRVGSSGILLKPAAHGMKKLSNRNRPSSKRWNSDSSLCEQLYYANIVKGIKCLPKDLAVSGLPSLDEAVESPPTGKHASNPCGENMLLSEPMRRDSNENIDDGLPAIDKDLYITLLGLVSTPLSASNNPDNQSRIRGRPPTSAACSQSSISLIGQSFRDNHHGCSGADLGLKSSVEDALPENARSRDEKGHGVVADFRQISPDPVVGNSCMKNISAKTTTESDLPNERNEPFSLLPASYHENEASADDGTADELCVVSVRSLASRNDGDADVVCGATSQDESGFSMSKNLDKRNPGRRLFLKQSPLDPSKRMLYLDADYSLAKPIPGSNARRTQVDIGHCSGPANSVVSATSMGTPPFYVYNSVDCTKRGSRLPSRKKTVNSRHFSTSEHAMLESKTYEFSKSKKRRASRTDPKGGPKESAAHYAETVVTPSICMTDDIITKQCVQSRRQSSPATDNFSNSMPKSSSRISQLRAMLRKKEADLEEARKTLTSFDDLMPG